MTGLGHEDPFPRQGRTAGVGSVKGPSRGRRATGETRFLPFAGRAEPTGSPGYIRGRYGNRPDQQPVVARVDHGMIHSEGRSRRGPQCARHPAAR